MAKEVLTQAELESLLMAVDRSGAKERTPIVGARAGVKVTTYDFKRPERVGKEQMRALQTLHEGFSRNFGAALSTFLRAMVEVKLTSVDQMTYGEFVYSLENPTCFNLLKAEPLEGHLILDINPAILYPIIDRLLGGGRDSTPHARRPLTQIELRLVSRITKVFLEELCRAWENVLKLDFQVERVESNPQLVQIVPPNEVIVLISFELTMGDVRGMLSLCIPFNSIERIGSKLTSNSWSAYGRKAPSPENVRQISDNLRGSTVEVVVGLAETTIATKDLMNLRVGDIITTDKDIHQPLVVEIEGSPKFHARAGAFKDRKAICIEGPIKQPPLKV